MSEREVICCDAHCSEPATCVEARHGRDITDEGWSTLIASCSDHCDHKSPHRCLPIVRYERGEEYDR